MPSTITDMLSVNLRRVSEEPIVAHDAVPGYGAIFNAGVIHHEGILHLFARWLQDQPTGADTLFNLLSGEITFVECE